MADRTLLVPERSLIDLVDLARRSADELRVAHPDLAAAMDGSVAEVELALVRPLVAL